MRGSSRHGSKKPVTVDITEHCKVLVDIVEGVKDKDKRLTALKAMELWQQRLKKGKTLSSLGSEDRECIFLHALVEGVLKENFHFTPYSTISYIGLGRKAQGVKTSIVKVHMKKMALTDRKDTGGGAGSSKSGAIPKPPSTQQSSADSNVMPHDGIRTGVAINRSKPPKAATGMQINLERVVVTKQDCSHGESSAEGVSAVKRHLPPMLLPSSDTPSTSGDSGGIGILPRKQLKLSRSSTSRENDRTHIVID